MATPLQLLLDERLGGDGHLEQLVRDKRKTKTPWRFIAREVHEATGYDVTHEALRSWFPDGSSEVEEKAG